MMYTHQPQQVSFRRGNYFLCTVCCRFTYSALDEMPFFHRLRYTYHGHGYSASEISI